MAASDTIVIRHGDEILWGEPIGEDGAVVWELERPDGTTERLGTLADMEAELARVRAYVATIRARMDELVNEFPQLKALS